MSEEPEEKNKVFPEKPGADDHSPAPAKDRNRDEACGQTQPGSTTDEIDSAEADEDTYD